MQDEIPQVERHVPWKAFAFVLLLLAFVVVGAVVLKKNNLLKKLPIIGTSEKPKKFELVEVYPSDHLIDVPVIAQPILVFSKKLNISENDIAKYVTIEPSIEGSWHLEKNNQALYFASGKKGADRIPAVFAYNSVYKITVSKSLSSQSGESLEKDLVVAFRTDKNKDLSFEPEYDLISSQVGPQQTMVNIRSRGLDVESATLEKFQAKVTVYSVDTNIFMKYFAYEKITTPVRDIQLSGKERVVTSFDWIPQLQKNTYGYPLDIPEIKTPGLYYVQVSNQQDTDGFFIAVSNHIAQTFVDRSQMRVWVTDRESGKSMSGSAVEFYKVSEGIQKTDSGATDAQGVVISTKSVNDVDFVVVRRGDEISITKTSGYYDRYFSSVQSDIKAYSYSDRPVYRPGDTVHYKAVVRKRESGSLTFPQSTTLYAKISNSYLNYVDTSQEDSFKKLTVDSYGAVYSDFKLPASTQSMYPSIILAQKVKDKLVTIDTLSLTVESYKKPDFKIDVSTAEKEYVSKDTAHVSLSATTLYGMPFSDVPFTYTVYANSYSEVKDRTYESLEGQALQYGGGTPIASGSATFDKRGKASLQFSSDLNGGTFESSQLATIEVVPNIGAAPSIGKVVKLVHRGEFGIFFEQASGNISEGIHGSGLVMDHATKRNPVLNKELSLQLNRVLSSGKKEAVASGSAKTNEKGVFEFAFDEKKEGSYEVVAQAKDSRENTVTERYSVYVGRFGVASTVEEVSNFEVKTDKEKYIPGDTAIISVKSNFQIEDAAVIVAQTDGTTNPREGTYKITSFRVETVGKNTWNFSVPIEKTIDLPLGVTIRTVHQGIAIAGYAAIEIDNDTQQAIDTSITFNKQEFKPGETVTATITTKDKSGKPVSADNSISVIDNAVLQVGGYSRDIRYAFYDNSYGPSVAVFVSTDGILRSLGGRGGGCFLEGTLIRMADGSEKAIEQIQMGDKILTRESDASNRLVQDEVTHTIKHVVDEYLIINGFLNVTSVHKLYVNGKWKTAGEIVRGDMLVNEKGEKIEVQTIEKHRGTFKVYNLTTNPHHTFFADGIYVHNEKGGDRTSFVDTAYWNPSVQTDLSGKATLTFKLPDNLTTFSAQVVSHTRSQFGQNVGTFVSKKDISMIPSVASYYFQGDKPEISVIVHNGSGKNVTATLTFEVKEINFSKTTPVSVDAGDFQTATFPVELSSQQKELAFRFALKDQSGVLLDGIQVKKPLLPKGSIESVWKTYDGSNSTSFEPEFGKLGFNSVSVDVIPHLASSLISDNEGYYFDQYPSSESGFKLYAFAYILAKVRDGSIPPDIFKYAYLRNGYRSAVASLLEKRTTDGYWPAQYEQSALTVSLPMILALREIDTNHTVEELSNPKLIADSALSSLLTTNKVNENSDEERSLMMWVTKKSMTGCLEQNMSVCAAAQIMAGDNKLYSWFTTTAPVQSAKDRLMWVNEMGKLNALPALAVIEKGTSGDADKAMKGLSMMYSNVYGYNTDPLAIVAAVKHAIRHKYEFKKPEVMVSVNDQTVYEENPSDDVYFSETFSSANTTDGKLQLKVDVNSSIPVYTNIVETQLSSKKLENKQAKVIDSAVSRATRFLDGATTSLKPGSSGVIELRYKNPVSTQHSTVDSFYSISQIKAYDALQPSLIYFDQSSGNSPQFVNALDTLYGGFPDGGRTYITASDYSDQFVFFNSAPQHIDAILSYVVYGLTGGDFYQPKTSVVYPRLGIVLREK